ncbi:N-acyl-phosphatidylethanolamine-hydrolyzing phospholipase D [Hypsibius exemplaris]|uniref:N-acetylphosphatidylethanolamine-hydrolyzing phospholipase D n=1 Tax=Hypsibius exemplaris TaxID=2072580 RepID=A0A1W0XAK8_HYPEX|nr:N-acyl-phosphatidylethanolamine-hydrolyzing phospholipase D [Hypsibius exemplaris]
MTESVESAPLNAPPNIDHSGKIGNYAGQALHYPQLQGRRYENPWLTWTDHGFAAMMRFFWVAIKGMGIAAGLPLDKQELDITLPVVRPDFELHTNARPKVTWLGHATVLVQMDGIAVLTDPVFSERCSPFHWLGTKRYRPVPCSVADLPNIDAVAISHNHYDHLDIRSVLDLNRRFGKKLRWYVPAGTARWMRNRGCENVVEMSWWEEDRLPGTDVVFAFAPSQHWCRRGLFDYCKQLWGSWCIIGPRHRFFFPGDTGYCEGFREIGRVYGPFDGAAIPIGAYEPRWFMKYAHVNPEEAVRIHKDVGSRKSIGIHWGTFVLTTEPYLEPPIRLKESLKEAGLPEQDFQVVQHGGSVTL